MVPLVASGTHWLTNGTNCTIGITIGTNGITNGTIGKTLNDIGIPLVPLGNPGRTQSFDQFKKKVQYLLIRIRLHVFSLAFRAGKSQFTG